jgi:hypothetical protein
MDGHHNDNQTNGAYRWRSSSIQQSARLASNDVSSGHQPRIDVFVHPTSYPSTQLYQRIVPKGQITQGN